MTENRSQKNERMHEPGEKSSRENPVQVSQSAGEETEKSQESGPPGTGQRAHSPAEAGTPLCKGAEGREHTGLAGLAGCGPAIQLCLCDVSAQRDCANDTWLTGAGDAWVWPPGRGLLTSAPELPLLARGLCFSVHSSADSNTPWLILLLKIKQSTITHSAQFFSSGFTEDIAIRWFAWSWSAGRRGQPRSRAASPRQPA